MIVILKKKEIYEAREASQRSKKIYLFEKSFTWHTYDNKIFISGEKKFNIKVLNKDGNHLYSIKHNYEPLKFTERDKQECLDFFRITPPYKQKHKELRKYWLFPETYPDIKTFFINFTI